MEKLKQPEVILTGANTIGLIGLAWFTINKFSEITAELETINTNLEAIGKQFKDLHLNEHPATQKNIVQIIEAMKRVDGVMKSIKYDVEDIKDGKEEDNIQLQDYINSVNQTILGIDSNAKIPVVDLDVPPSRKNSHRRSSQGRRREPEPEQPRRRREPEPEQPRRRREPEPEQPRRSSQSSNRSVHFEDESDDEDPRKEIERIRSGHR